jgi:hypothetical protein
MEVFTLTQADAVFIIDADAIISAQCPNPFETLPEGMFSVVGLSQRIDPDGRLAWCGNEFEWGKLIKLPGVTPLAANGWRYFNSGMMMVWRTQHESVVNKAFELCHIPNDLGWIEQTPINYACKLLGVQMNYAEERWNYIHPMCLGPMWKTMRAYAAWVYHGAGDPSRISWLKEVDWR